MLSAALVDAGGGRGDKGQASCSTSGRDTGRKLPAPGVDQEGCNADKENR